MLKILTLLKLAAMKSVSFQDFLGCQKMASPVSQSRPIVCNCMDISLIYAFGPESVSRCVPNMQIQCWAPNMEIGEVFEKCNNKKQMADWKAEKIERIRITWKLPIGDCNELSDFRCWLSSIDMWSKNDGATQRNLK